MACRVLKKINTKLNFLWSQSNYYSSRRLLCNALIQLHFDYGFTSWFPLLSKALKTKLQIAQNKCIHFCLELLPCDHINPSYFRKINWLLVEHRVFMPSLNHYNTILQKALDILLCTITKGQKSMSFLGLEVWNKLNSNIKTAATTASFMHHLKK